MTSSNLGELRGRVSTLHWNRHWKWKSLRGVQLFVTWWTIQSMEFSRPEYWSGSPFPSPGDLPNSEIEPASPALQADSLLAEQQGKPKNTGVGSLSLLQQIFPTQELNWGPYIAGITNMLNCHCYYIGVLSLLHYFGELHGLHHIMEVWSFSTLKSRLPQTQILLPWETLET